MTGPYYSTSQYIEEHTAGDVNAMNSLGVTYVLRWFRCWGVEQSYERAKEYYKQAAHLGHVKAQFDFCGVYENVKEDM